jgi:hypothetical protein
MDARHCSSVWYIQRWADPFVTAQHWISRVFAGAARAIMPADTHTGDNMCKPIERIIDY